jgi:hypothetical protein
MALARKTAMKMVMAMKAPRKTVKTERVAKTAKAAKARTGVPLGRVRKEVAPWILGYQEHAVPRP